jgi:hypothetical protein
MNAEAAKNFSTHKGYPLPISQRQHYGCWLLRSIGEIRQRHIEQNSSTDNTVLEQRERASTVYVEFVSYGRGSQYLPGDAWKNSKLCERVPEREIFEFVSAKIKYSELT